MVPAIASPVADHRTNRTRRYARVVERLAIHPHPKTFRSVCRDVVSRSTRYLVLDLDRTVHSGINLGVEFGWELAAWAAYGDRYLEREPASGSLVLQWGTPAATARYLLEGARRWAVPGLAYLFGVKLASRSPQLARSLYQWLGDDPVQVIEQLPRLALMHQMSGVPHEVLTELAQRAWVRHLDRLVVFRDDIAWLRHFIPGLRVVLSSASPQPVVDVAARELEVDVAFCTTVDDHDGAPCAPFVVHPWLGARALPHRIAGPSGYFQNAGSHKVDRLVRELPDFLEAETVGITDTSYGEDHAWLGYFRRVVDVNSPTPFPPIIAAGSPLESIDSVPMLLPEGVDAEPVAFSAVELAWLLGPMLDHVEELCEAHDRELRRVASALHRWEDRSKACAVRIERAVGAYNRAAMERRALWLRVLRRQLYSRGRAVIDLGQLLRGASRLGHSIDRTLHDARAMLGIAADQLQAAAGTRGASPPACTPSQPPSCSASSGTSGLRSS